MVLWIVGYEFKKNNNKNLVLIKKGVSLQSENDTIII